MGLLLTSKVRTDEEQNIVLNCQSPLCGEEIREGCNVVKYGTFIFHNRNCLIHYGSENGGSIENKGKGPCTIEDISYKEALKLARKRKINYD